MFIVISVLIFNPWAAIMVMIVVVSMTVELAGFMGISGVKLNPISAVTLVTAVGIGRSLINSILTRILGRPSSFCADLGRIASGVILLSCKLEVT